MNFAFVINNIGNSEVAYELLKFIHSKEDSDFSPYIFFQNNYPPVMSSPCMTMNISGLVNFKGKAVAINLDCADILSKNNSVTENYLYLWDLQWLFNLVNYDAAMDILDNFKIIARSKAHKAIVENYTGRNDILLAETMDELYKCLI
jgi:hypothetical protein